MPSIYIINPATSEPTYHTLDVLQDESGGWVMVADLTSVSLAAFVPARWEIRITDEAISPVDLDAAVDFVAITGKVSQANRMIELAEAFRERGRTILIGGPFATLDPEAIRPHADVLVTGELEDIAESFFADLAAGTWKASYNGGKADLRRAPLPRWDLYPVDRAQVGALQTTRGCPFTCEFCDVIQYQGRKQRHKDIDQIVRELDALHLAGFRRTFLVDDNFTVHRAWARTVLQAIAAWNAQHDDGDRMSFYTQVSLDIVRDGEMLELCRAAGFFMLFMGVETINEESLRETGKKQNLLTPMTEAIERVVRSGLGVHAGIIVGFDHDGPDIFDIMKEFMYDLPVPQLSIGVLSAPKSTDLYRRLQREGRLIEQRNVEIQGPFTTNVVPLGMSRDTLLEGALELSQWAYAADNYARRVLQFIHLFPEGGALPRTKRSTDPRSRTFFAVVKYISALGAAEAAMVQKVLRASARKPLSMGAVTYFLVMYAQTRFFLSRHSLADRTNRSQSERRLQQAMTVAAMPDLPGLPATASVVAAE